MSKPESWEGNPEEKTIWAPRASTAATCGSAFVYIPMGLNSLSRRLKTLLTSGGQSSRRPLVRSSEISEARETTFEVPVSSLKPRIEETRSCFSRASSGSWTPPTAARS